MTLRFASFALSLTLGAIVGCSDTQPDARPDAHVATDAGMHPHTHVATDAGPATDAHVAGEHDAALADAALINAPNNPFPCNDPVPAGGSFEPAVLRCANGLLIVPRALRCEQNAPSSGDHCFEDTDCEAGRRCACSAGGNYCASDQGQCRDDRDCARGFHCAYGIHGASDSAIWHLACQKPDDECIADSDCAGDAAAAILYACQAPEDHSARVCSE